MISPAGSEGAKDAPNHWGDVLAGAKEYANICVAELAKDLPTSWGNALTARGVVIGMHGVAKVILGDDDMITQKIEQQVGLVDSAVIEYRNSKIENARREQAWNSLEGKARPETAPESESQG